MAYIYRILNKITQKCYIGESKCLNINRRWNQHKKTIENNKGYCPALRDAVIKYGIENFVFTVIIVCFDDDRFKYETLRDIFSMITLTKCIIYCNSVKRVIDLYNAMMDDGFSVCCIHSNMDKVDRNRIFQQFRTGDTRIMISSDITARGIDIQQVSTVINFDLTRNVHTYLHRIGRGGRWGRKGVAINFVSPYDIHDIRAIEKHYNIDIPELPPNFHGDV